MTLRVSPPIESFSQDPDNLSIPEMLAIIDGNRTRTRTLGTMVLTVCGMLLSATFVVIFFILNSRFAYSNLQAIVLLFASALISTSAIFASLISATMPLPVAAPSKLAVLDTTAQIAKREVRWVRTAVVLLAGTILAFGTGLVVFAWHVLSTPIPSRPAV